ncbi:MAG: phosphatidylinositol-specific phospholipase C1-like protein [Novosphingobium sp.]
MGAATLLTMAALTGSAHGTTASCDLAAQDVAAAGEGCENEWMDHNLRLNDLVVVGTHNSYKADMPTGLMDLIRANDPRRADAIDYRHVPLSQQLDAGIRQLEIDIYADPKGRRYLEPAILHVAGKELDPDHRARLAEPGFKVMHVQDVDIFSSCVTLQDCLRIVRHWSLGNPHHVPLLIMVNAKTGTSPMPGGVAALPFDTATFADLDQEIRSVFPGDALITPDDVQGDYPSLREAALDGAWPALGDARGRIMFALDEGPEKIAAYLGSQPTLKGRVFFLNVDETSPLAAYLTINDPVRDAVRIRSAVARGFIVRTRADADTVEARANDRRRWKAALESGAQFISTDYYWPEPQLGNAYHVRLPGDAAAQCNPVRTALRCARRPVEHNAPARSGRPEAADHEGR